MGASEDYLGHVPVETPEHIVARTSRIKTECDDLKTDLKDVLDQVDSMLIRPAQEARDNLHVFKKTIKKRDDKKLDFERYQSRVDSGVKKTKKSDRDNAALAKAEKDLEIATEAYKAADERLRQGLPPVLQAIWSLQPFLLSAQIQIQNSLLGHYYTSLHSYCSEEGFPNPAPSMDEIIRVWDDALRPTQKEAESINILAHGKTVRLGQQNGHSNSNGYRRPSATSSYSRGPSVSPARAIAAAPSQAQITDIPSRPKINSTPSSNSLLSPQTTNTSDYGGSPSPSHSAYATPMSYAPAGPTADYFSRDRQASQSNTSIASNAIATMAAGKKKPPPPPPRKPSDQFQYVTALYDFGGQGDGDLVFREGDKIRVIKKTGSTDDWWQGELRGVKGMFPANYCR